MPASGLSGSRTGFELQRLIMTTWYIRCGWPSLKLSVNTLCRPGADCLLSLHTDFIIAWTLKGPRGAESWGMDRERMSRSSMGVLGYRAPLFLWQSHYQPLLLYPMKCTLLQVVSLSKLCSSTLLTWYYLQCLKLNAKGNICNPLICCSLITPNAAPFISDRAVLSLKVFFLLNWALQCYVIEGIVSSTSPCLDQ